MKVDQQLIKAFARRFCASANDEWFRTKLANAVSVHSPCSNDHAALHRQLQLNLTELFVPTSESIKITSWIYETARGFVAHRYQSRDEYIEVCMARPSDLLAASHFKFVSLNPEDVPVYAIHGVPGVGKTSLSKGQKRVFPPSVELVAQGAPSQRLETASAAWIQVNTNFSLLEWVKNALQLYAIDMEYKTGKQLSSLSIKLFKAFYRMGVSALFVDELQFASGRTSALRAISQLLAMRNFGVPIFFFANSDFIERVFQQPAQISQRIPADIKVLSPMLRGSTEFEQVLEAQLKLVPFGHQIDVQKHSNHFYDLTAGSPRGTYKLILIATSQSIPDRRPLTFDDIIKAQKAPAFDTFRAHVRILSSPLPVDAKKHPELASGNPTIDATRAYQERMRERGIEDAAALHLQGSLTADEREQANAVEIEILKREGKIPANVDAIGSSKKRRAAKQETEQHFKSTYAAEKLRDVEPKNDTSRPRSTE